ncbi:hypothetical protein [Catenovulum adriaticum]|uniref:AsmA-like protein n=1 Tax=Catenovulum adriaticum TaxID=2984846 RepID=A0ABY7AMQ6_9ALTE|nr:hypothetical protein [Catenovulum sp. TS8]WAJ69581.1 hypothetical protein OLW01_10460 [Catenovulum sp. TS8]
MKTRYKLSIGIIIFIFVFVLADKLIDRTPIVQSILDDVNQNAPYTLTIKHLEHSFLQPGLVIVDGFNYQDEFAQSARIEHVKLNVNIPALIKQKVLVEVLGINDVTLDFSEQGINDLISALAKEQPEPNEEENKALPISVVELDELVVLPVKLDFEAQTGNIKAEAVQVKLSNFSLLHDGVFDLNQVKGLVEIKSDNVELMVQDLKNTRDNAKIELAFAKTDIRIDINQTKPSQVTLQSFNLQQLDALVDLGKIEEASQNVVEEVSEEVKVKSKEVAADLIELPIDLFIQQAKVQQANLELKHGLQTVHAKQLSVDLTDWAVTDNKQFILAKLKGQLALKLAQVSQREATQAESDHIDITPGFHSLAKLNDLELQLDLNQTQSGQLTVQKMNLAEVELELNADSAKAELGATQTDESTQNEDQVSQSSSEQALNETAAQSADSPESEAKPDPKPGSSKGTQAEGNQQLSIEVPFDVKVEYIGVNKFNATLVRDEQKVQIKNLSVALKQTQLTQNKRFMLDKINSQIELSIEQLNALDYQAKQFIAKASVAEGKVDLVQLDSELLGGELSVTADATYIAPYVVNLNSFTAKNISAQVKLAQPKSSSASESENPAQAESNEPEAVDNSSKQTDEIEAIESLIVNAISINNVNLELLDPEQNKVWFAAKQFSFELDHLPLVQAHKMLALETLKSGSNMKLKLDELTYLSSIVDSIALNVTTLDQGIEVNQSGFQLDGGHLIANSKLTTNNEKLNSVANIDWKNLNLDRIQAFVKDSPIKPQGRISGNLQTQLNFLPTSKDIKDIDGEIKLETSEFDLKGIALDKIIDGFRSSQETSLLDVGAFMVSGPLGMVAMNFAQLGSGAAQLSGSTKMKKIKVDSHLKDSVLTLNRANIQTKGNHLGLYGKVDLAKNRFKKLRFGILNDEGCANIKQTLDGPFAEVKDVLFSTTTGAVTSPLSSVFNQAANLANGGKCKSFFPE